MAGEALLRFKSLTCETADTKSLTRSAYSIIPPWAEATSDNRPLQHSMALIRLEAKRFIGSASQSYKNAQSDYEFAKGGQNMCKSILDPANADVDIQDLITEMRGIAHQANEDATITANSFRANRIGFNNVVASIPGARESIDREHGQDKEKKDRARQKAESWGNKINKLRNRRKKNIALITMPYVAFAKSRKSSLEGKAQEPETRLIRFEDAVKSLPLTERRLADLMEKTDMLAHYWLSMDSVLEDIHKSVAELRISSTLQRKIKSLIADWNKVGLEYGAYEKEFETPASQTADTKSLIRAAYEGVDIIAPWAECKAISDNHPLQHSMALIRVDARRSVGFVTRTSYNTQLGYGFPWSAKNMCKSIFDNTNTDAEIQALITEMREVACQAHKDATNTANSFRANRVGFNKVVTSIPDALKSMDREDKEKKDRVAHKPERWGKRIKKLRKKSNFASDSITMPYVAYAKSRKSSLEGKAQEPETRLIRFEDAVKSLPLTERRLADLMEKTDMLAHYWLSMDSVLEDIHKSVAELRISSTLQRKIKSLNADWNQVGLEYGAYNIELGRLKDLNPTIKANLQERDAAPIVTSVLDPFFHLEIDTPNKGLHSTAESVPKSLEIIEPWATASSSVTNDGQGVENSQKSPISTQKGYEQQRNEGVAQVVTPATDPLSHLEIDTPHKVLDSIVESASRSMELIEPWSGASTDHPQLQLAIQKMQAHSMAYFEAIDTSIKTAQDGYGFSTDAIELCGFLLDKATDPADLKVYIADMQDKAKCAHEDSRVTLGKFRDVRKGLVEITKTIPKAEEQNKDKRAHEESKATLDKVRGFYRSLIEITKTIPNEDLASPEEHKAKLGHDDSKVALDKFQDFYRSLIEITKTIPKEALESPQESQRVNIRLVSRTGEERDIEMNRALEELNMAASNLEILSNSIDEFARWWAGMETVLSKTKQDSQDLKPGQNKLRVKQIRTKWAKVQNDYRQYKVEIMKLQDYYPSKIAAV